MFIFHIYPKELNQRVLQGLTGIAVILVLVTLLTSASFYSKLVSIYEFFLVLICVWLTYTVVLACLRHRAQAPIVLIGMLVMAITALNDILFTSQFIHTAYLAHFGLTVFIFFQSAVLALRFANTYRRAEQLNVDLDDAYQEIVEKEKARTLFFHNTSHELRTPLSGIIGFTQLLSDGRYGNLGQAVANQVGKVQQLAESLKQQVNTILDLAKSKKGELSLEMSTFNLQELKQECQILAQGLNQKEDNTGFEIVFNEGKDESNVFYSDREKILTILRNLLGNAFKFRRQGAENLVKLEMKKSDNSLQIKVSDTGIGIPKDQIDKVFEEFKQVEGEASRSFEGTGLGLTMVKNIVDALQGKIEVESEPGQGSCFLVFIPEGGEEDLSAVQTVAAPEAGETSPTLVRGDSGKAAKILENVETDGSESISNIQDGEEPEHSDGQKSGSLSAFYDQQNSKYNLLVVDDIPINVEVISELLRAAGYQVMESLGGQDALDQIKQHRPDLMLLDLMMPDVSGEEVMQQVRADESLRDLPVILVTARASQEDRLLGLGLGADDYLAKPIVTEELLLRVKGILTRIEMARLFQVISGHQSMAQMGYLLGDVAKEINDLQTVVINSLNLAKPPFENGLRKFEVIKPLWASFVRALFNPYSVSLSQKSSRQQKLLPPANLAGPDSINFRILSSLMSELEVDDDFLFQSWQHLAVLQGEELSSFIEIVQAVRAFAAMRESTSIAHHLTGSIMKHLHNKEQDQGRVNMPELIKSGLGLVFNRLERQGIKVDMNLPSQKDITAPENGLSQVYLGVILALTHLLAKQTKKKSSNQGLKAGKIMNVSLQPEQGDGGAGFYLAIKAEGIELQEQQVQALWSEDFQETPDSGADESILNLSFCRQLAQKRGGSLEMQQTENSLGFTITWPGVN